MDVIENYEQGKETNKNILKEDTNIDLPHINNNTQPGSNSTISRRTSISSSSPDSSPESVVTEKEVVLESPPDPSPKELVFPDLLDPAAISSPLDFSPQFTPILQSPRIPAPTRGPSSGPGAGTTTTTTTAIGYDPNRIPASIFSKPSTPKEWSVASNESLFSIHAGNTSFSKDQFVMMYKSGDMSKLDELNFASSTTFPRHSGANSDEIKRVNFETNNSSSNNNNNKEVVVTSNETIHKSSTDGIGLNDHKNCSVGFPFRPDETYKSTRSFQFPVFEGNEGRKIPFPMVDSRRHRGQQIFQPQPQPLTQIMDHHQHSQSFETKPKYGIPNWLLCFSCCCRPCS